jgi:hypothetical protein
VSERINRQAHRVDRGNLKPASQRNYGRGIIEPNTVSGTGASRPSKARFRANAPDSTV